MTHKIRKLKHVVTTKTGKEMHQQSLLENTTTIDLLSRYSEIYNDVNSLVEALAILSELQNRLGEDKLAPLKLSVYNIKHQFTSDTVKEEIDKLIEEIKNSENEAKEK